MAMTFNGQINKHYTATHIFKFIDLESQGLKVINHAAEAWSFILMMYKQTIPETEFYEIVPEKHKST